MSPDNADYSCAQAILRMALPIEAHHSVVSAVAKEVMWHRVRGQIELLEDEARNRESRALSCEETSYEDGGPDYSTAAILRDVAMFFRGKASELRRELYALEQREALRREPEEK